MAPNDGRFEFRDRCWNLCSNGRIDDDLCCTLDIIPGTSLSREYELLTTIGLYSTRFGRFNEPDFYWACSHLMVDSRLIDVFLDFLDGKYKFIPLEV